MNIETNVHTTADLVRAAGQALADRDELALTRLLTRLNGWMLDDRDAEAYRLMLGSMLDAVGELPEV